MLLLLLLVQVLQLQVLLLLLLLLQLILVVLGMDQMLRDAIAIGDDPVRLRNRVVHDLVHAKQSARAEGDVQRRHRKRREREKEREGVRECEEGRQRE